MLTKPNSEQGPHGSIRNWNNARRVEADRMGRTYIGAGVPIDPHPALRELTTSEHAVLVGGVLASIAGSAFLLYVLVLWLGSR